MYLEMWTSNRFCQLVEKRLLNFCKFAWIHDFKDVFYFVEKHDLFGTIDFRPISK